MDGWLVLLLGWLPGRCESSNRQYSTYKCVKIFQFGVWMIFCWMIFRGMPSSYLDSEWFYFDDLGWNCLLASKILQADISAQVYSQCSEAFPNFCDLEKTKSRIIRVNKSLSTKKSLFMLHLPNILFWLSFFRHPFFPISNSRLMIKS